MSAYQKTTREIEDLREATFNRRTYTNHVELAHALGMFYRAVHKATDMAQVKVAVKTLEDICA